MRRSNFESAIYSSGKKILFALVAGFILTIVSCDKDDDDDFTVTFMADISGSSEVPANASTATGDATLTYDTIAKKFSIVVNFSGVTATAAHIHKAAPGVSGDIVFPFITPITSPINYTSPVLNDAQEADLFAGLYYVNIHSAAYPAGEIRGQLVEE